ncbi:MAG: polysaccharide deacetylase family protein [Gammaproteobacteria bacterium]|nr:polysaccharide deacetylase family protein [Gammaproteobacteria bacterium]
MRVALRVEVKTLQGAVDGLPALLHLLDEYKLRASFLFSLGPDYSPYLLNNQMPDWLLSRLPATLIGQKARDNLKATADAGHEVGIGAWSPRLWQRSAAKATEVWTRRHLSDSIDAFHEVFGKKPQLHGASGWQLNPNLLQLEEQLGFRYASDTRGRYVYYPTLQDVRTRCPQIPTTLPTLNELLSKRGVDLENVHQYIFSECQRILPHGEVFSLSAESEGMKQLVVLERLLVMWKGGQWDILALDEMFDKLDREKLIHHQIGWGQPEGGTSYLATQSLPIE